ncbi:MAG TPA: FkbM family methyltransferase [Solirubrobacteraceae bacterium]|nr:FkbM family methyltransferase [Solirubrobacteraceae bacterium]
MSNHDVGAIEQGPKGMRRRLRFLQTYASWRMAVRELWRFKWHENRRHDIVGGYHTRTAGVPYFVRHTTRDIGVFSEVFVLGEYVPPREVADWLSQLGRPPRILDVGGNIGLFATFARDRWPGAEVVSIEPDPDNLEILRRNAEAGSGLQVVAACASDHDGTLRFVAGQEAGSHVADAEAAEEETIEVPCVDVFRLADAADLIKIDIEGSEWEILADPRFAELSAGALVMEWHELLCPHAEPRKAAREALERAGFTIVDDRVDFPEVGMVWAVRSDRLDAAATPAHAEPVAVGS